MNAVADRLFIDVLWDKTLQVLGKRLGSLDELESCNPHSEHDSVGNRNFFRRQRSIRNQAQGSI
jgi:hypothetical protein